MSGLSFEQPQWIHLVWALAGFVAILFWLDLRGSVGLDRLLSTVMQQRLVSRPKRLRRLMRVVLLGCCGVCLILALMRPQGGLHLVQMERVGARIMVCLDVSKSMLAEDVRPNRLRRAKAEILDLLAFLESDHVGLIAFAGKATVLCPMTPDFGFLRGVMETAGPHSVARGGTNLEAPIRKALDGFRGQSDVSRAIILITDGEDHDSFPLEAAKAAAERGVRIIAIGFGDEAGSEVLMTDPQTGARTTLLDADEKPVVTRLDAQTLRKIAVETGGAYVPAGTGVLDLTAIYEAHISPLTRGRLDDHGRMVAKEQYQWAVLLALACLIAAVTVASSRSRPPAARFGAAAQTPIAGLVVLIAQAMILPAHAATPSAQPAGESGRGAQTATDQNEPEATPPESDDQDDIEPRLAYNEALSLFSADKLDEAETKFSHARRRAGADGRARYSATYNLGWIEVKRANRFIKEKPKQALSHLHVAADWFREAVRLRPDEVDARENLEIIGRRAMALADALAGQEPVKLAAQLDQLIEQQRSLATLLQGTVQRVANLEQSSIPQGMREEFRGLEVEQRRVMTRLEEVTQLGREEIERLEAIDKEKRTSDQGLRLAQLQFATAYLYQASQRAGQTRRHLRGLQADRAYRRASVALDQLKRARDQLRDLVEVLSAVIVDATLLTKQTALFASNTIPSVGLERDESSTPLWLTREFIFESLDTVQERTQELVARVEAGLESGNVAPQTAPGKEPAQTQPAPDAAAPGSPGRPADQERVLAMLREAAPLIRGAADHFREAEEALQSQRDQEVYRAEAQATASLMQARELFLEMRQLIELIYADQRNVQGILKNDVQPGALDELVPLLAQLQASNIARGGRLMPMFDSELEQMAGATTQPATVDAHPGSSADATEARTEQLELAKKVLASILHTFDTNAKRLERLSSDQRDDADVEQLHQDVDKSVEQIETLRRIFFSVIEHLRDTLRRQVDLADQTRDGAAVADPTEQRRKLGPLAVHQQVLSSMSHQIAESLQKQSEQPMPQANDVDADAQADPGGAQGTQDAADRLRRAAGHVNDAKTEMDQAYESMSADPADVDGTLERQAAAIQKLTEALALLEPPPPPESQNDEQQKDQPQQQTGKDQNGQQQTQHDAQADISRLLQAVRDRDAQRQRDKQNRRPSGYAPVEKDW